MPAEILDGRALAQQVRRQVAADVAAFTAETGVVPGLTVVLVGDDPASQVYVRNKETACKAAGMNGTVLRLPVETTQAQLLATIDRLNADPAVHGILVQLPLPGRSTRRPWSSGLTRSRTSMVFIPSISVCWRPVRRGLCLARRWASASS